jgi:hypothetical protein
MPNEMLREDPDVLIPEPVSNVRSGRRGRPRKQVDPAFLREAMSAKRNLHITKLADAIGLSRHTLRSRLREAGIELKFAALSDADLDLLVRTYRHVKPNSGIRYLIGFLRSHGLRVQKARIRRSILRVDGIGRVLRQRTAIRRRKYKVARPNALWHVDGHHKLILWGIVIHGIVDGYSRMVWFWPILDICC